MYEKYRILKNYLGKFEKLAIAFSGGVDSTLLLLAAHEALGEKVVAITVQSDLFPEAELNDSKEFTKKYGIKHIITDIDISHIDGFTDNPNNRCYICKKFIFERIKEIAETEGINFIAEGSIMDDNDDYRPGMKAIEELGIISPLKLSNIYKHEIRQLLKSFEIPVWEKPSFACLASRFVYGEKITTEKLDMVRSAEQYLIGLGFKQIRVRLHHNLARIELNHSDMEIFTAKEMMEKVNNKLKSLGFNYVTLDLQGFRSGSMNEVL